jgi:hypothetical protein
MFEEVAIRYRRGGLKLEVALTAYTGLKEAVS